MSDDMDDMKPVDDISVQEILINMMDATKNLGLKTEINKPKDLASLSIFATYMEKKGYKVSAGIIRDFIKKYLEYMVSNKRKGRKEIIDAISAPNREVIERKETSLSSLE